MTNSTTPTVQQFTRIARGALLLFFLCPLLTSAAALQSTASPTHPVPPQQDKPNATAALSPAEGAAKPASAMTPEKAREAKIVADTATLYRMVQELQAGVAKSDQGTLSLALVKQATEVETLAKSLKKALRQN